MWTFHLQSLNCIMYYDCTIMRKIIIVAFYPWYCNCLLIWIFFVIQICNKLCKACNKIIEEIFPACFQRYTWLVEPAAQHKLTDCQRTVFCTLANAFMTINKAVNRQHSRINLLLTFSLYSKQYQHIWTAEKQRFETTRIDIIVMLSSTLFKTN